MNNYSANQWLDERFNGPDAHLWFTARKMMLLSRPTASALDLLNMGHMIGQDLPNRNSHNSDSDQEKINSKPKYLRWTDNSNNSVKRLIYDIVTRWNPEYLDKTSLSHWNLHRTLIDIPCKHITSRGGARNFHLGGLSSPTLKMSRMFCSAKNPTWFVYRVS
jgi:hypothetical protein